MNSRNGDGASDALVVDEIAAGLADQPGALMLVLHAVNERLGYIPAEAVPAIARALNLSRAEVHGVISFYHDFRTRPDGRKIIRVCRAELGYIPAEAVPAIARALNLSRAEVHGVISFYHDFRTRPDGRKIIRVCRA